MRPMFEPHKDPVYFCSIYACLKMAQCFTEVIRAQKMLSNLMLFSLNIFEGKVWTLPFDLPSKISTLRRHEIGNYDKPKKYILFRTNISLNNFVGPL